MRRASALALVALLAVPAAALAPSPGSPGPGPLPPGEPGGARVLAMPWPPGADTAGSWAGPEAPAGSLVATIVRDRDGVPHVYADDLYALAYANGFAQAQDRLFLMEMLRRAAKGTLAEVLGPAYVASDVAVRNELPTEEERVAQHLALDPDARRMWRGFADGVNRALAEAALDPLHGLPAELAALGVVPAPWSVTDSFAIAQLMLGIYGAGGGGELRNARLLGHLEGSLGSRAAAEDAFADLVWAHDPAALPTIPGDGGGPWEEPLPQAIPAAQWALVGPASRAAPVGADAEARDALLARAGLRVHWGSNAALVAGARSASGGAMMWGGPQVGYAIPGFFWEVGLHGAGFEVTGVIPPGNPGVIIGRSARAAWSVTSGLGDQMDVFAETLHPEDDRQYRFQGAWRAMDCRDEVVLARAPPLALVAEPAPPEAHVVELCRTVHGPVVAWATGDRVAFAAARSHAGREVESGLAWVRLGQVDAEEDVLAAVQDRLAGFALSFNVHVAADDGGILFLHAGRSPRTAAGFDPRLPVPGDGSAEWLGMVTTLDQPRGVNPPQGYLVNWNNLPARGVPAGDERGQWPGLHRAGLLDAVLREALAAGDGQLTFGALQRAMASAATRDPFAGALVDAAGAVVERGGACAARCAEALGWLRAWGHDGAAPGDPVLGGPGAGTTLGPGEGGPLRPTDLRPGFLDLGGDGLPSAEDPLVHDADRDGLLSVGDVRLGLPGRAGFGSVAAPGDPDAAHRLRGGAPGILVFADRDGDGAHDRDEGVYLAAAPGAVAAGDVRVANPGGSAVGSQVLPGDPDAGLASLALPGAARYHDADGDAAFSPGDGAAWDADDSGSLTAGDVVLAGRDAGKVAAAGTGGLNNPLRPLPWRTAFLDADGDGAFGAGDVAYADLGHDGFATIQDLRLGRLAGLPFGSAVAPHDPDATYLLVPLALAPVFVDRDGDGRHDPAEPVLLGSGGATVAGNDVRIANPGAHALGTQVRASHAEHDAPAIPLPGRGGFEDADGDGRFTAGDTWTWDTDASGTATAGDVVLSGPRAGDVLATQPGDPRLLRPARLALGFFDADADAAYTSGDAVLLDADGDGLATAMDVRMTRAQQSPGGPATGAPGTAAVVVWPFGSTVGRDDPELTPVLRAAEATPVFVDRDGDGAFDASEPAYLRAAPGGVHRGDVRIANPGAFPLGSRVLAGDTDEGAAAIPLPGGPAWLDADGDGKPSPGERWVWAHRGAWGWTDRDGDGRYDHPGHALYDAWLERLVPAVFADELGPFAGRVIFNPLDGGDEHAADHGTAVHKFGALLHVLHGEGASLPPRRTWCDDLATEAREPCAAVAAAALEAALGALEAEFGTADMAAWRLPLHRSPFAALSAAPAPRIPMVNRGSYNQFVDLGTGASLSINPPGQSGLTSLATVAGIAPEHPHLRDQLGPYVAFDAKPMRLDQASVEAGAAARVLLVVPPPLVAG